VSLFWPKELLLLLLLRSIAAHLSPCFMAFHTKMMSVIGQRAFSHATTSKILLFPYNRTAYSTEKYQRRVLSGSLKHDDNR
jgi:hypothetical protein